MIRNLFFKPIILIVIVCSLLLLSSLIDGYRLIDSSTKSSSLSLSNYEFNDSMNVNKMENFYDIPSDDDDVELLHDTFLLSSSVNSIRYWSIDCPIHHSYPLLINSSRHTYRTQYGISGMSLYKPPSIKDNDSVKLLWFDVPNYQLYYGTLYRSNNKSNYNNCHSLLSLKNIQTLRFMDTNPYKDDPNDENFVHLIIDANNHLLFLSNLLKNRIDIYEITEESFVRNEIKWLKSLNNDTNFPKNIQIDSNEKLLFWIESWIRLCYLNYSDLNNLVKMCSNNFYHYKPITMAIDTKNKKLLWSDKSNNLLSGDYFIKNENDAKIIHQSTSISSIIDITLFPSNHIDSKHQWIFIQDQHEIQMIDLSERNETTVLIESQTIFESLLLTFTDNNSEEDSKFPLQHKQKQNQIYSLDNTTHHNSWYYSFHLIVLAMTIILLSIICFVYFFIYPKYLKFIITNQNDDDTTIATSSSSSSTSNYEKLNQTMINNNGDNIFSTNTSNNDRSSSIQCLDKNLNKCMIQINKNSNDIEDIIVPIFNDNDEEDKLTKCPKSLKSKSSSLSFTNPLILLKNCDDCNQPGNCQNHGLCLATFSRNLNLMK